MKTIVCGIGNQYRNDDAAGLLVASKLKNHFKVFHCDTYPESFVEKICKENPDNILIIDAAEFGENPGSWREIKTNEIDNYTVSTHTIPISLFVYLLKKCCNNIKIFAVQIENIEYGEKISKGVKNAIKNLTSWLIQEYKDK